MKLLGIVILYYPDDAVVKNIATYLAQLDELMLWDNTPATDRRDLDLDSLGDGRGKIILDGCGENLGIGSALNKAVAYARANGFTHLLTLDQDSCFDGRNFESYLRAIRSYGEDRLPFSLPIISLNPSKPPCIRQRTLWMKCIRQ